MSITTTDVPEPAAERRPTAEPVSVLVTGVRGKTGREVARALGARRGVAVRGGGREPGAIAGDHVEAVRFDWADAGTWEPALDGVHALYLVKPDDDAVERVRRLLRTGSLRRVVLLSEIAADEQPEAAVERQVEQAVRQGPVPWTILRPSWFMQDLVDERFWLPAIRDEGRLAVSTAGQAVGFVDTRDIAAVAVAALTCDEHAGAAYTLTGPEAITVDDLAARVARASGRAVEAIDPPLEDVVDAAPASAAAYVARIHRNIHRGAAGRITDAVERVTGRPARTIDAFVTEHAAAWRR